MPQSKLVSDIWRTHFYESSDAFEFCDLLDLENPPAPRQVYATLLRPESLRSEPVPCVVAIHGSMGWRGHHHEYMVRWLEQGIAVLRVHSFDARQVKSIVADQMAVTLAMMLADAFGALALLSKIPIIDIGRVGVAGWSIGGSVALYSALEKLSSRMAPAGLGFAAHLCCYPAAHVLPEEMHWSSAPIQVLTGREDDYTPVHYIETLAPLMQAAGAKIEVTAYEDAHHSYDSPDPLTWVPEAIRLGKKFYTMDADGHLYLKGSGGAVHRVSTPEERKQMFKESKNVGAHVGVNWPARRASMNAASQFFADHLCF